MIVYPAIDIRGGKVVRLREGDPERQQVFHQDPVETASKWIEQGAEWIHMVNLDGAFSEAVDNITILKQVASLGIPVQFGGGLRSLDAVEQALAAGASRAILGTLAVQNPEKVDEAIERFGAERISIALDARNGYIATHGWQVASDKTVIEFGQDIAQRGARHALYTDVSRDGSLAGAAIADTIELAESSGLSMIASGGIGTLDEIRELAHSGVVAGVIVGMALYTGQFTLKEALQAAQGQS